MRKFSAILAVVLVAGLAATLVGYVHFERMFPLVDAWIIYADAVVMAKLSMTLSGLVTLVSVILAVAGWRRRRMHGSANNACLVSLVLGLGALAFAGFVAAVGYSSIRQAMAITGATDPIVTAPGHAEVMLVLALGLLAPAVASIGGALLADRPAVPATDQAVT